MSCGTVVKVTQGIFYAFFVISDVTIRCAKLSDSPNATELTNML